MPASGPSYCRYRMAACTASMALLPPPSLSLPLPPSPPPPSPSPSSLLPQTMKDPAVVGHYDALLTFADHKAE